MVVPPLNSTLVVELPAVAKQYPLNSSEVAV